MIPFIFSCGRNHLLKATYESLRTKFGPIMERSIVIEDPCIQSAFPDIKIAQKVTHDKPSGLAHSFYRAYSTFKDTYYLHMEDDWIANISLDMNQIEEIAKEYDLDQVYLSSKKLASNPKLLNREKIDLGNAVLVIGEVPGHMIPNSTPSIMKYTMFKEFVDRYSEVQSKALSPMKAWKFWRKTIGRSPKKYGVIIGKEYKVLTHIGETMRARVKNGVAKISGGRDLIYTVGIGDKYFKLANNLAESFRLNKYKQEFVILTDCNRTSEFATVLNVENSAPRLADNHLRWNLDPTAIKRINPIMTKLCIDQFLNLNDYKRITYIDADSILSIGYKTFFWKMEKSREIFASRINKKRNIIKCLRYYKAKYKRVVTDLTPAFTPEQLEQISKKPGVCGGLFSWCPSEHPDFLKMMRETYEANQPATDQECLNFLIAKGLVTCRIKKDIYFSSASDFGKGLLHFTSHKSECFRLVDQMRKEIGPVTGFIKI